MLVSTIGRWGHGRSSPGRFGFLWLWLTIKGYETKQERLHGFGLGQRHHRIRHRRCRRTRNERLCWNILADYDSCPDNRTLSNAKGPVAGRGDDCTGTDKGVLLDDQPSSAAGMRQEDDSQADVHSILDFYSRRVLIFEVHVI